jgi:hypothetical protein
MSAYPEQFNTGKVSKTGHISQSGALKLGVQGRCPAIGRRRGWTREIVLEVFVTVMPAIHIRDHRHSRPDVFQVFSEPYLVSLSDPSFCLRFHPNSDRTRATNSIYRALAILKSIFRWRSIANSRICV